MKKIFLLVFLVCTQCLIHAQAPKNIGTIEIYLYNFESNNGNVRVHLYDSTTSQYFPAVSDKRFKLAISEIHNKKAVIVFDSIPYGSYAITVHHDQNLNVKMDLNILGFPKEGWGLSRDVMPTFSLPPFEDCKFELNQEVMKVKIKIRNGII